MIDRRTFVAGLCALPVMAQAAEKRTETLRSERTPATKHPETLRSDRAATSPKLATPDGEALAGSTRRARINSPLTPQPNVRSSPLKSPTG
jgi:hypothetical protein